MNTTAEEQMLTTIEELEQENHLLRARNDRLESLEKEHVFNLELVHKDIHTDQYEQLVKALVEQQAPVQQEQSRVNPGWCQGCTPDNCHGCEGRYTEVDDFEQPAQRTWVGLTHDEDDECARKADAEAERKHIQQWSLMYRRAIEAKLKEKNE